MRSPARPRALAALALPATLLPLATLAGAAWLVPAAGCRGPDLAADASPQACADCHAEVVAEWRDSAHARAFTSPTFQAAAAQVAGVGTAGGEVPAACAACHAPDLVVTTAPGLPAARAARREAGVDCRACHMDATGALVGPFAADEERLFAAHPVRKDYFLYRTSALCGSCHPRTLAETERWGPELGGVQPRCQECHMPAVERGLTQGAGAVRSAETALAGAVRQRRHGFGHTASGPWGQEPVAVSWTIGRGPEGWSVEAALVNRLPHGLPTGEKDLARYRAVLLARDGAGAELGRVERALSLAEGSALDPGQPLRLRLSVPTRAAQAELELRREATSPRVVLHLARALEEGR